MSLRFFLILFLSSLLFGFCLTAEDETFSLPEANCRGILPPGWTMKPPKGDSSMVLFMKNPNDIIVLEYAVLESTPEDMFTNTLSQIKLSLEEVNCFDEMRTYTVAGECGVRQKLTVKSTIGKLHMVLISFCHQGIGYTIRRVWQKAMFRDTDFDAFLKGFSFIGDRPAWLAQHRDTPLQASLGGGLIQFQVGRPRWVVNPHDTGKNWQNIQERKFDLKQGGASFTVALQRNIPDLMTTMEQKQGEIATSADSPAKIKQCEEQIDGRVFRWTEITGAWNTTEFVVRLYGDKFFNHGLFMQMDSVRSRAPGTRNDWIRLLQTLRIENDPKILGTFPIDHDNWNAHTPDHPRLATILSSGQRILPEKDLNGFCGFLSATKAIARIDGAILGFSIPGKNRLRIPLTPTPTGTVRCSPNAAWIAWMAGESLHLSSMDGQDKRSIKLSADDFSLANDGSMAITTQITKDCGTFQCNALYYLAPNSATPVRLLNWPLTKWQHPSIRPDGSAIAFSSNHETSRRGMSDQIALLTLHDKQVRNLTNDNGSTQHCAWNTDGSGLLALRLATDGKDSERHGGHHVSLNDLWLFPLDQKPAERLCFGGGFDQVFSDGSDVLVSMRLYDVSDQQRGLWRIPLAALRSGMKKSSSLVRNTTPVFMANLAKAVREVLGGPIEVWIPDEQKIALVAEAFAKQASMGQELNLDFSKESLCDFVRLENSANTFYAQHRELILGVGAYYGETLRRTTKARWHISPLPFGQWTPGGWKWNESNADVILPWSDCLAQALSSEEYGGIQDAASLSRRRPERPFLLVYPGKDYARIQQQAESPQYRAAMAAADAGDLNTASKALEELLHSDPHNETIATTLLNILRAAEQPQQYDQILERAIAAGNSVPTILCERAKALTQKNPDQALELLKKAQSNQTWLSYEHYELLAKAQEAKKNWTLAEECLLQAHAHMPQTKQPESIKNLSAFIDRYLFPNGTPSDNSPNITAEENQEGKKSLF